MRLAYQDVTIANGQSLSTEADLRSHRLVAIEIQGTWTAAGISFKSCIRSDGTGGTLTETFLPVVDQAGAEATLTNVATGKYITVVDLTAQLLRGLGRTKLVSGTNAIPVAQGQAVTVRLVLEPRED